jgi:hypothetical protein
MTVASATYLDTTSEAYVADVLDAIEEHGLVTVLAAYVLGSGAIGGFDPQTSDIDLVAVVDRGFDADARAALVERIGRLGCPARGLELVVYVEGAQPPDFELNVNADAHGAAERPDEPAHWFVIDAAVAQEYAAPFGDDEPWQTFFSPIAPERIREAIAESIAWSERQAPGNEFARLNALRSRHYLDRGEWISKKEVGR